jgi:AhpC/TSA family protein
VSQSLGDAAPEFTAETTDGPIRFHDGIGNRWAVLFSHSKDFTPVSTTEPGYVARLKPKLGKRGVKAIGLCASWDPGEDVIIVPSVRDEEAKVTFPKGVEAAQALSPPDPAPIDNGS